MARMLSSYLKVKTHVTKALVDVNQAYLDVATAEGEALETIKSALVPVEVIVNKLNEQSSNMFIAHQAAKVMLDELKEVSPQNKFVVTLTENLAKRNKQR